MSPSDLPTPDETCPESALAAHQVMSDHIEQMSKQLSNLYHFVGHDHQGRLMKTLYLVSCVGQKRASVSLARDLYTSPWFVKAREFVESQGGEWKILSALYGVVDPLDSIEPYEKTLNTTPIAERRVWADTALQMLQELLTSGDRVIFLAGARYREFLEEPLKLLGIQVDIPMRSLGIGQQLQWLQRHTEPRRGQEESSLSRRGQEKGSLL